MFDKHKGSKESEAPVAETRAPQPAPAQSAAPGASSATVPGAVSGTSSGATAMIGKGISIAGDVSADSNLRIEGVIEGRSVQSAHDVEVSESGKVTASISAKVVRVAGEVTGDITGTEKVMIAKSGRVQGNVVAPRVQLEDGALFRGSIDMNPAKSADARPAGGGSSSRPTPVDTGGKGGATTQVSRASEAAAEGTRKEPGLSLKSG